MRTRHLLVLAALAAPIVIASPAAAAPPTDTFGSHVSSCAQVSTGFGAQHNPSHHRGPDGEPMEPAHC